MELDIKFLLLKFDSLFKRFQSSPKRGMPFAPGLILQQAGDVKNAKITIAGELCQISDIQKYLKKKTTPQLLGTFPYKGNTLHLIGYKEGKAGTENKHELPPPLDNQLFFGDILVILSKDKRSFERPILMKPEEYEAFYTQMFEGFESLGEDDLEDDENDLEEDDELDDDDEEKSQAYDEEEEFQDEDEGEQEQELCDEEEKPEEVVIVHSKKKQPKPEKAKAKAKVKEPLYAFIPSNEELQTDTEMKELSTAETYRRQVLAVIEKNFTNSEFTSSQQKELEHHIYNTSIHIAEKKHITKSWKQPIFVEIYLSLARTIIGNLSTKNYVGNKTLFQRWKEGRIDLHEIVQYGYSDLYPEIWKELSIRQFEREKRQLEGNKAMATDQFYCKRCGKKECTYYELQTRSADEPMTIFIQCVNCGKHWRQ